MKGETTIPCIIITTTQNSLSQQSKPSTVKNQRFVHPPSKADKRCPLQQENWL